MCNDDGIKAIIDYLNKDVLFYCEHQHSYPYDWRTKKPVIILGSKQWFIDTKQLRDQAKEYLKQNVQIYPEGAGKSFLSMADQRPYWCISRQRNWGVPIPVFYRKTNNHEILINEKIIEHLIEHINKTNSIDLWWSNDIKDVLPPELHKEEENLVKSNDIFDVWFDSGSSFYSILKSI